MDLTEPPTYADTVPRVIIFGFRDRAGRTFRKWADQVTLPYLAIGKVRIYRRADIDRAWFRNANNILGFDLYNGT